MLDHLVHYEPEVTSRDGFLKLDDASPNEIVSAQYATTEWLKELGVESDEDLVKEKETDAARKAFGALTTTTDTTEQKATLAALKTPEAVRHLTGMLSAYDWAFIDMARELRGYTVAKIVEETQSPNANIRLKALGLLGKVTEVGLFTEKIEVQKAEMSDNELDQRIKDKLNKFMEVVDILTPKEEITDIESTDGSEPDHDADAA
jgi:hypothetical protein